MQSIKRPPSRAHPKSVTTGSFRILRSPGGKPARDPHAAQPDRSCIVQRAEPEPAAAGSPRQITGFHDMAPKRFHLVTEWDLDAPVERVWPLLTKVEDWPHWWRAVNKA